MPDKSSGPDALAAAAAAAAAADAPVDIGVGCSRRDEPKMSCRVTCACHGGPRVTSL